MKILYFLFLLGVCFTIFEFIWGIFKMLFNVIISSITTPVKTNSVRIIKYILFTAVTIQFVQTVNMNPVLINKQAITIALSGLLILFYLIGKYQNRAMYNQFRGITNQFVKGLIPVFDSKLELALIIGSVSFYVIGSLFPQIANNAVTQWFTSAILNIYNTPFFGFVFKIIAAFVLINTFTRAGNIIGKLLSGQSFANATKRESDIFSRFNQQGFNRRFFQNPTNEEPEYTDYEEIVDDEVEEK